MPVETDQAGLRRLTLNLSEAMQIDKPPASFSLLLEFRPTGENRGEKVIFGAIEIGVWTDRKSK